MKLTEGIYNGKGKGTHEYYLQSTDAWKLKLLECAQWVTKVYTLGSSWWRWSKKLFHRLSFRGYKTMFTTVQIKYCSNKWAKISDTIFFFGGWLYPFTIHPYIVHQYWIANHNSNIMLHFLDIWFKSQYK